MVNCKTCIRDEKKEEYTYKIDDKIICNICDIKLCENCPKITCNKCQSFGHRVKNPCNLIYCAKCGLDRKGTCRDCHLTTLCNSTEQPTHYDDIICGTCDWYSKIRYPININHLDVKEKTNYCGDCGKYIHYFLDDIKQICLCGKKLCKECATLKCSICHLILCRRCIADHCNNCSKSQKCIKCDEITDDFKKCSSCDKALCLVCADDARQCSRCYNPICEECDILNCDHCEYNDAICKKCAVIVECECIICTNCISTDCLRCKKQMCEKHDKPLKCQRWDSYYCAGCAEDFIICYGCSEGICDNCIEGNKSLKCDLCDLRLCNSCYRFDDRFENFDCGGLKCPECKNNKCYNEEHGNLSLSDDENE